MLARELTEARPDYLVCRCMFSAIIGLVYQSLRIERKKKSLLDSKQA